MSDPGNVPDGYNEKPELGRPIDSITKRNTQADNFGKDRLGTKRMKDTDKNEGDTLRPTFEAAKITFLKNKDIFKSLDSLGGKKLIFEEDKDDSSLLDESQLKEQ